MPLGKLNRRFRSIRKCRRNGRHIYVPPVGCSIARTVEFGVCVFGQIWGWMSGLDEWFRCMFLVKL